nr:lipoprotein [Halomonas kenyensis]
MSMIGTGAARLTRPLALAVLLLALLAGCGQKGPLYLPDDEAADERYGTGAAAPNDDES